MLPSLIPVLGCPASSISAVGRRSVRISNIMWLQPQFIKRHTCHCHHHHIIIIIIIIISRQSSIISRQSSVVIHHSSYTVIIRSSIALHYRPSYHPSYVIISHPQSSSVIIHRHHQSSIHQSSIRYLSVIHHLVIHQSFIIIFTIIFVIIIFSHNSYHLVSIFVMHVTPACSHRQQRAASVPSRRPANLSFDL